MYATTGEAGTGESDKTVTTEKDSFKIEFDVDIADLDKVGAGGISDLWAWLAPAGKTGDDDDRDTILSYLMMPDTDPKSDDGDIINFGECVTYLLFPYLTCGDSANWTTAIAIANTTMDDGVFGISGGAAAQGGNIMLHAFPRSTYGEDGMKTMGRSHEHGVDRKPGCRRHLFDHLQQCHARVCRLCHRQGRLPSCPWSGLCPG